MATPEACAEARNDANASVASLTSQQKQARMWQLVRVVAKLIPSARQFLPPCALSLSKQQVMEFLAGTLGDPESADSAPHPVWGEAWDNFFARFMTWAFERAFTPAQIRTCMHQQANRKWAVVRKCLASHLLTWISAMFESGTPCTLPDIASGHHDYTAENALLVVS
jgi:hypothetical protein